MSSERLPPSMSLSEMRKEIECDLCDTTNPSKRCSRCHMVYYCSKECQKLHWFTHKVECEPVEKMKNKMVGVENLGSTPNDTTNQTNHDSCAICLSEAVEHPIVLPCCGHIFCFKCLHQWQSKFKNSSNHREKPKGRCPCCRKKIQENIEDAALEKARLFATIGGLTHKVYDHHLNTDQGKVNQDAENVSSNAMDARQEKFCKLAEEQLNQVLSCDPTQPDAILIKGKILRYVKPYDAIDALRELLRVDVETVTRRERLRQVIHETLEFRALMKRTLTVEELESGNNHMEHKWQQLGEAGESILLEKKNDVYIGKGPYRLFQIRTWLAEAFESTNDYKTAGAMFEQMWKESFQINDEGEDENEDDDTLDIIGLAFGLSRCKFRQNDFELAKNAAEAVLDSIRHFPGSHILKAQAQWALKEKKEAIRTMCRGVLYEAPWDEANRERNIVYLQEFVDAMNE
jgi:tetratricopeptide (TPR) repeat protein